MACVLELNVKIAFFNSNMAIGVRQLLRVVKMSRILYDLFSNFIDYENDLI